jgi:arylsulfatase A-like enzyme
MAISWPARIKNRGGISWQFHHVIDIAPTILDVSGIRSRRWSMGSSKSWWKA